LARWHKPCDFIRAEIELDFERRKDFMEKTYSQKVSRVFEIICYLLLIPTFVSLIYPFIMFVSGLTSGQGELALIGLLPFAIVGVGIALLIGYYKHSRGFLEEKKVPALWMTTAIYNLLLLLPWLGGAASVLQKPNYYRHEAAGIPAEFLYLLVPIFGYIFAIVFAMKAYSFERRQKYI
jgi:hypothetical protein